MIQSLDFSHERDIDLDDLKLRMQAYFPDADYQLLEKSYKFAKKAHEGQKRSSGEEYFIHPINVAATLIKLKLDMDSVVAGLLHDVVEDCDISPEEIEKEFNPEIAQIVVGLTKISKITKIYKTEN